MAEPRRPPKKNRAFCFECYPDDTTGKHEECLNFCIRNEELFRCVYILHDRDVKEDGTLKKPHVHVLIYFNTPRYETSMQKIWRERFDMLIIGCDLVSMGMYLTHETLEARLENKPIYPRSEVRGSESLKRTIWAKDEDKLGELVDLILSRRYTFTSLTMYCVAKGDSYLKALRRDKTILMSVCKENYAERQYIASSAHVLNYDIQYDTEKLNGGIELRRELTADCVSDIAFGVSSEETKKAET